MVSSTWENILINLKEGSEKDGMKIPSSM